jgi:hypothetical protein
MNTLLLQLLWRNQNHTQLAIALLGYALGLLIMLLSLQLYVSLRQSIIQSNEKNKNYIVVSKKVSWQNATAQTNGFTKEELADLAKQPFTAHIGKFTANEFQAAVRVKKIIPFYTLIFFESVPNRFLDQVPPNWYWKEGQAFVPIIISSDFLNLYNFGFALSRGLPQVSKETIGIIPLELEISGKNGTRHFEAQIVGFSDRIASVLVPQSFMDKMNQEIAGLLPEQIAPSRLMIETKGTKNTQTKLEDYVATRNYEVNSDQLKAGKAADLLQNIVFILGAVGILLLMLSFSIGLSTMRLLLAESKEEIRLLLLLGYRINTLNYHVLFSFSVFLLITSLLTWLGTALLLRLTAPVLAGFDVQSTLQIEVTVAAILFVVGTFAFNWFSVRYTLYRLAK